MVTPLQAKKEKRKKENSCLHEIHINRDAQTDFHTVQESEFIG
jgi:hypothetical protein